MLLALDVGNTHTTFGIFEGHTLLANWRVTSSSRRTADEWGFLCAGLLAEKSITAQDIQDAVLSCVVPPVGDTLQELFTERWKISFLSLGPGVRTGLSIRAEPKEVGADRIANAVGAMHRYGGNLIIIDFGTATTFCAVTAAGEYLGGAIAPGIAISAEALYEKTAKLPRVGFEVPGEPIGRNTVEAVHVGLFQGQLGICREMVGRIKTILSPPVTVVGTGGWGKMLWRHCDFINYYDPFLTLEGLRIIYDLNKRT